jgi:leucyl/phenylalanyl-tRNA--protein transferase
MKAVPWLDPYNDTQPFPNPERALENPDGLLAVGGSLSPKRLLRAYRDGIFPWYSSGQPILWWSPNPRMVLFPERLKISRSLRKTQKKGIFSLTMDRAFAAVIQGCSEPRPREHGTWITPEMQTAYRRLYQLGYAHSVETWHAGQLVGGLYGVAIGRVFFGESMFSRMTDASKIALVGLVEQLRQWEFTVIDCQMRTDHLISMGAVDIPRHAFLELLEKSCVLPGRTGVWGE